MTVAGYSGGAEMDSDISIILETKQRRTRRNLRNNVPRDNPVQVPVVGNSEPGEEEQKKPVRRAIPSKQNGNVEESVTASKKAKKTKACNLRNDNSPTRNDLTGSALLIYPPEAGQKALVSLIPADVDTLRPKEYLNDQMIDFWLQYMYREKLSEEDQARSHIFSSYFYSSLCLGRSMSKNKHQKSMHRNWTKSINIFDKDFIFVPISLESHWFLAVICFPSLVFDSDSAKRRNQDESNDEEIVKHPRILIFDSMPKYIKTRSVVYRRLWTFLTTELKCQDDNRDIQFSAATIPACVVDAPKQNNRSDCGLFMFKYFENFFSHPIKCFEFPLSPLKLWFDKKEIKDMRSQVYQDILRLTKAHFPNNLSKVPVIEEFCTGNEES